MCEEDFCMIYLILIMRVCMKNGKWFMLDNCRLWVFRRLEEDGYIIDVDVNVVSSDCLKVRKFIIMNGGVSVCIC